MNVDGWWEEAFGKGIYPLGRLAATARWRRQTRSQLRFLARELRLRRGSRVLDVGVGIGRHAVPLAQRGCRVTGLDISRPYLREAARAARRAGVRLDLVLRDMRRIDYDGVFDGAVNLFTSFGYFPRPEDDLKVLRGVRRALKPGGRFLLDTINGPRIMRLLQWQEDWGIPAQRWAQLDDGTVVLENPELLKRQRAVRTKWLFFRGRLRKDLVSFTRMYSRKLLTQLLRRAGLRPLRFYGDLARTAYHPLWAFRLVVLAERPIGPRNSR